MRLAVLWIIDWLIGRKEPAPSAILREAVPEGLAWHKRFRKAVKQLRQL